MVTGTSPYLEEKTQIAVELSLAHAPPRSVELSLPKNAQLEPTVVLQTLKYFFAQKGRFIPARDVLTESWFLFQRDQLCWVRLRESHDEAAFEHRCHVTLELNDQSRIEGELLFDRPPESARPVDYMNEPEEVLSLYQDDSLWLIWKGAIQRMWDAKSWE